METSVDLSVGTLVLNLKELEALVSDIKILSKKKIKHDEEAMRMLGSPKIDERRIYAKGFYSAPTYRVRYTVEDYVLRRNGSGFTRVGSEEYDSRDLRKS